jgi:type VI secretion system protein
MNNETLLERIRNLEKSPDELTDKDASRNVQSILQHLRKILNTRQGSVLIADDYGMPDLTNFPGENLSAAAEELEEIMKVIIQRYEPRLVNVKVGFEPESNDSSTLRFKLSAESISGQDTRTPIIFETVVTSEGMVRIDK